jgi:hypothetical protein
MLQKAYGESAMKKKQTSVYVQDGREHVNNRWKCEKSGKNGYE